MNPWRAFSQSYSTAYWESIFCYGQVWVLQKPQPKGKPLNVPTGWRLSGDNSTLVAPNGHYLQGAYKDFVLAHDWHPEDQPQNDGAANAPTVLFGQERLSLDKSGIHFSFIGPELVAAAAQIQSLQSEVSQADATIQTLQAQAAPSSIPSDLVKNLNTFEQSMNTQLGAIIDSLAPPKGN
jgi:hypothetical protein